MKVKLKRVPALNLPFQLTEYEYLSVLMRLSTLIFLGFSVIISLALLDSYVNNLLTSKVNRNTVFLTNSELIIRTSSKFHKVIIEMQSAFRGYLLSENDSFLTMYYDGLNNIPVLYGQQKRLIYGSEAKRAKLDSIFLLHKQWVGYANALLEAKKEVLEKGASPERYQELFDNQFKKQVGQNINNQISRIFREFDREEYRIRQLRREKLMSSIKKTESFSMIFAILTVTVGILSSVNIVRLISRRISLMVNQAESISRGRFTRVTDDKNDELSSLSDSLNVMSVTLSENIAELQKKNSELNQFAYIVSHDLKAPIRGIYNVIQWIEEDLGKEISPQMRKYLSIIPARINRMEGLIHGILDYARISRDKPLKERVDLNSLIREITEGLVPSHFKIIAGPLPVLYAERVRLEQVFSNLVSNAVKYTPQAGGIIEIESRELEDFYEFTVKDNGIGIDSKFNDKIFEIFQTLRDRNQQESTGVGLAIVKKIVEEQHGSIKVVSEIGRGAAFVFTWPRS